MRKTLLLVALALFTVACTPRPDTVVTEPKALPDVSRSPEVIGYDDEEWKTYTHELFEIGYRGALVDDSDGYIRMQNYNPNEDRLGLAEDEYYMEIFPNSEQCPDSLVNAEQIDQDGTTMYRGLGQPGGDAGGNRFGLCVETAGTFIYAQVTEPDSNGTLADQIFDSFKLRS